MRNKKLLVILLEVLCGYILIQILFYALAHRSTQQSGKITVLKQDYEEKKEEYEQTQFQNIKLYVDLCLGFGVPVILLDPVVLQNVLDNVRKPTANCQFFCDNGKITVFGVVDKLWKHDVVFLSKMTQAGFTVMYFTEEHQDTVKYLSDGATNGLHTHYIFHRFNRTIHQVVMFEKSSPHVESLGHSAYWWHGHISRHMTDSGNHFIVERVKNTDFGRRAGAYDSPELIKVTLDGIRLRAPKFPLLFLQQIPHSTFLQCNHSRAKLFYSMYGKENDEEFVAAFREANRQVLAQAKAVLDGLGIRFWLSSGTCLGWYRQCDPISYSGDVDIGIWIKDYDKRLVTAMIHQGLAIKHIFGKESDSFELSFQSDEVKLDIFFFYEEMDHMWNGGTQTKSAKKYKYIFPKFTLCWTEFLDLKVRVPCGTEQYLRANYGRNWFEPVRTWDWKQSPSNVMENGKWPATEWDKVIQIFD